MIAQLLALITPLTTPTVHAQAKAAQVEAAPVKINVTTTVDEWSLPGNSNEAIQSKCSLREALQAVVGNVLGNQGCGFVAANESQYVLQMIPGVYKLTKAANKPDPLPDIGNGKTVTIDGHNAVTLDGGGGSGRFAGIFRLVGGGLVLKNIILQKGSGIFGCAIDQEGGVMEIDNATFKDNDCVLAANNNQGEGGAIYSSGVLTVTNSLFDNNAARRIGGAMAVGGVTYLQNVTFKNNFAWLGGGAIANYAGHLTVSESLFEQNRVIGHPDTPNPYNHLADYGSGGAIRNAGTVVIDKVAFRGNNTTKVKGGGALSNEGGEAYIYDSAFQGNKANPQLQVEFTYGGAIYNGGKLNLVRTTLYQNEASYGGAIFNRIGEMNVANSTISSNRASKEGPGIANGHLSFPNSENGLVWIDQSTLVYNQDASGKSKSVYSYKPYKITVLNSLLDGGCDTDKAITRGYNIFGAPCNTTSIDNTYDFTLADLNPIADPSKVSLGGLTFNGGPTLKGGVAFSSHKPQGNSVAIDAAGDEGCTHELIAKFDQTGKPRAQGDCDMGAIEGGTNPPKFASQPAENGDLEFATTPVNNLGDFEANIELKNEGGGVYSYHAAVDGARDVMSNLYSNSTFFVVNYEGWVFPNQPVKLIVRCRPPLSPGDYYTYLSLYTDLKDKPLVKYVLHCVQPDPVNAHASPSQPSGPTSMGDTPPGGSSQSSFTITGRGQQPVNMTAQSSQTSNGAIQISATKKNLVMAAGAEALAPITLAHGEQATFTATCTPPGEGLFQETLTLQSNDPRTPTLTYNFACAGVYQPEATKLSAGEYLFDAPGIPFWSVAVSPDGTQLLGGHFGDNGVRSFVRNTTTGDLVKQPPIALPAGMDEIMDIEFSRDGKQVFFASAAGDGVVIMNRATDGSLSQSQVITKNTITVCLDTNGKPVPCYVGVMDGAFALAVSPDDQQLYVAAAMDGTLTVLQRNPNDPAKFYPAQSFTNTINGGPVLAGAGDVIVSPDGKHLYISARQANTINVFARSEDGSLRYRRSYEDEKEGLTTLRFPGNMSISADGKFLYVPSYVDDALNVFARSDSDGSLQLVQTVPNLNGAFATLISHDPAGERLLLSLYEGDALQVYARNVKTGEVTFVESHNIANTGANFDMPVRIASSPDDRDVYVALRQGQGIQSFASLRKQPTLATISPASAQVNSGDLILTVNGRNFYPDSQVIWNGTPLPTTFVDGWHLKALISAGQLANAGVINVQVRTSQPGGDDSAARQFTITTPDQLPTPSIESINPAALVATLSEETSLLVKGANFTAQSQLQLNASPLPTTFVNATTLVAILAPGAVSEPGPLAITVVNRPSAEIVAAGLNATLVAPTSAIFRFESVAAGEVTLPSIQTIEPVAITAGSEELQLTISGANFVDRLDVRSVLLWNGEPRPTTVVNANTLLATIAKSDLASASEAAITVYNEGAGLSIPAAFRVLKPGDNPLPLLYNASAELNGGQWLLSLYGENLMNGAQTFFNKQSRVASVVDATQINLVVSEAELNSGGVVQVINPAPGGGSSGELVVLPRRSQSLSMPILANQIVGGAPLLLDVVASSGLRVQVISKTPSVCIVKESRQGWIVSLSALGSCTLVAQQSGDGQFAPALAVERSFQVVAVASKHQQFLPLVLR
ncbi:MAG: beta-propeller fold lactonase family protein [Caldilineaceae bacterium]